MIIREFVEAGHVAFHQSFVDWEEAVRASCETLKADGTIEQAYEDAVVNSVKKYGPYIVLAPNIAMPHAQQGAEGVLKTAIGFMKVEEPVSFEEGNPEKDARLFFTLASQNPDLHLENMGKLAELLGNEAIIEELLTAKSVEDLLAIDMKYDEG